jgi:hypothetical protein
MRGNTESQVGSSRGERGQALIIFVLAAGVLFGFMAMTIDVGLILHQRRELQNTADAAALAGAIELPDSPGLAYDRAQEWAELNGIDTAAGDQLDIAVDPVDNSVTVRVEREEGFIFGRVLGLVSTSVHADATARVGSPLNLAGILPFGVLESAVSYNGNPTTIKYDASNPSNGNFGPLRIDGNGAAVLEQSIMYGTQSGVCAQSQPACVDPTAQTETGNTIGAARDGFDYRFNNTSGACDDFTDVLISQGDGTYRINGPCNPFLGSPESLRLVLVPVIDNFPNGSQPVTLKYFTALFLDDFQTSKCTGNSCEVTGKFVKIVADPANDATLGTYDPINGVKLVRLVE